MNRTQGDSSVTECHMTLWPRFGDNSICVRSLMLPICACLYNCCFRLQTVGHYSQTEFPNVVNELWILVSQFIICFHVIYKQNNINYFTLPPTAPLLSKCWSNSGGLGEPGRFLTSTTLNVECDCLQSQIVMLLITLHSVWQSYSWKLLMLCSHFFWGVEVCLVWTWDWEYWVHTGQNTQTAIQLKVWRWESTFRGNGQWFCLCFILLKVFYQKQLKHNNQSWFQSNHSIKRSCRCWHVF